MLRRILMFASVLVVLTTNAVPAFAVTDGELDGNRHPYVVLLIDGSRWCAGVSVQRNTPVPDLSADRWALCRCARRI